MFAAWLDWPVASRDSKLATDLADKPEVLTEVQRLIRADARAAMLPTQPPEPRDLNADMASPERVGAYRLTEQIGRGGMGLVFRGERDDGIFRQTVAVKLIRRSLFAGSATAQFAIERQILARLRHPHIAQLFDGGVTPDGESYIVMELIDGEAITTHCDTHALPIDARIALMGDVCAAVQFAHQQLIVHADIKPSNVVIDVRYGVKLLDFGIARMIDATTEHGLTSHGQTPAFASPQQASGEAPTPADDIYALGRLIELLAGPVRRDDELDAVIARATAPERQDRYSTAGDLAADLARWRGRRPVHARPASRARSARMFVRRHWIGVGLSALAVIALLSATVITGLLYVRTEAARRESERRFVETRQLSRYLLSDLTDALQRFPGASRLRHDLALRGRSYLETLSHVPGAPLDMQIEIADGYARTAKILGSPSLQGLGDPTLAKRDLAVAETRLRRLMTETGGRTDVALALSSALSAHASIAHVTDNDVPRALRLFSEACSLAQNAITREPGNDKARMTKVQCLAGLANIYDYEGRYADMKAPLEAAFAALRATPAGQNDAEHALALGNFHSLRGDYFYYGGPRAAALAEYRQSATVLDDGLAINPDVRLLERLAWADFNYGAQLDEDGHHLDGLAMIDRGVAAADRMLYFEKSPRAHHIDNVLHIQRAITLGSLKRFPEAIAEGEATLNAFRAAAVAAPRDFEAARAVPVNMRPVGELYWDAGRHADACAMFIKTRQAWDALARHHKMIGSDLTDEIPVVRKLLARCPITRSG